MTLTRRQLLAAGAAACLSGPLLPRAALADVPIIRARTGTAFMLPNDTRGTEIWGYDGIVPGPVIRLPQGARLKRRFVNQLTQPSTIHWHGIRLDNGMDGVPDLTQDPVQPDSDFTYDFIAPDAGTYWYHPHIRSWEQMARGLNGALIVDEPDPPAVDRDEVLLIDDWRLSEDAQIHESFGAMSDWSHAGRLGNWLTVNGHGDWHAAVSQHDRLRLRLVNTANARIFVLDLDGLDGWVVALDGQPLEAPVAAGRMILAPAQRIDLIVDVTASDGSTGMLTAIERDQELRLATFPISGQSRAERLPPPAALTPNPIPPLNDPDTAMGAELRMSGGAMGGMAGAVMDGRYTPMREMVDLGMVWAFNGYAGIRDEPLLHADRGTTVRLTMVNDTAFPHGMHLHGHHFRQLREDGSIGPLRDTILMQRGETVDIAFVADNPGKWLLHCHMLEHAVSGMTTWIEVSA